MLLEWLVTMKKKLNKHRESLTDKRQDAQIERLKKEELKDDVKIERLAKEVAKLKHHEHEEHKKHRPVAIKFKFGKVKGQTMPANLNVGQTVTTTPSETDAQGGNVAVVGANVQWTIDTPSVASFVVDDHGVATWTALSAGVAQLTVTDTKYNLSFSDSMTVAAVEQVPTGISFSFGTPA